MKKLTYLLWALILVLCASSCGQTKYALLDMVPADAEFAASFSPTQIASKAGITVTKENTLQFPQAFIESSDAQTVKDIEDIEDINNFLLGSFAELDSMAVYLPTYQDQPVYIIKLRDKDRFVKKLMENGYAFIRGQFGIMIYYCKTSETAPVVAVRGNIAVLEDLPYDDIDDLWRCFYKPDGNPMSRSTEEKTFIKGDIEQASNLPRTVSQILSSPQPQSQDILLFVKTIMGIE